MRGSIAHRTTLTVTDAITNATPLIIHIQWKRFCVSYARCIMEGGKFVFGASLLHAADPAIQEVTKHVLAAHHSMILIENRTGRTLTNGAAHFQHGIAFNVLNLVDIPEGDTLLVSVTKGADQFGKNGVIRYTVGITGFAAVFAFDVSDVWTQIRAWATLGLWRTPNNYDTKMTRDVDQPLDVVAAAHWLDRNRGGSDDQSARLWREIGDHANEKYFKRPLNKVVGFNAVTDIVSERT